MVVNDKCKETMVIKEVDKKKRLSQCQEKWIWSVENNWGKIVFFDEGKTMIGHYERVYVWRKAGESKRPDFITPKPRHKFEIVT